MGSSLDIGGKVAIITGGSRGLGRAIAEKLCAGGCHVIVNYANSDSTAQDTVNSLARLPGSVTLVKADVREHGAIEEVVNKAIDVHGRLDIFVHNAATLQPMSAFAPDPAAVYREQELALNPLLFGAGILAKAMNEQTGGRVIAIWTALLDKTDPNTSGLANPAIAAMLAARTPAGRLSTPADVADAVALLCAPEAAWIHGQVITVDGGLGLLA